MMNSMDSLPWKHILADKLPDEAARPELHPAVEAALIYLEANGLETKGLFRVPGSASHVKALKENFIKHKKKSFDLTDVDTHTVCSLLTDHLRNEEPLLTYNLAPRWIQASGMPDLVVRLTKYVELINQLPVANHATLFALVRLLVMISQHADKTLMPATNLGTIFGPMICRRLNSDIAQELVDIPAVSKLCIDLITHFSQLFDYYDLEPGGAAGGFGMTMFSDGGYSDSPRSKKNTRRKFQFGKEKSQGDRPTGIAAAPHAAPATTDSETGDSQLPSSSDAESASGRSRATAVSFVNRGKSEIDTSDRETLDTIRSPKTIHLPVTEEGEDSCEQPRSPGPRHIDNKAAMRSLSSMGGFYGKNVGKLIMASEDKQDRSNETDNDNAAGEDSAQNEEDEDRKGKSKTPLLNIKKRKESSEKKKLRMFSPRKLFDKDRVKTAPDGSYDSSDTEQRSYDGSSSSERDERASEDAGRWDMKFGGRMIPFRSPRRKSSSWPEAELAELHRRQQESDDDNNGGGNEADPNDESKGSTTVTSQKRKGSNSERVPSSSHSARKANKASSPWTEIEQNQKDSSSRKKPTDGNLGSTLSDIVNSGSAAWNTSSPRAAPNLRSPRTPGGPLNITPRTAAASTDALESDTNEAIAGRLADEELGFVKWKKRVASGSARQRSTAPTPASPVPANVPASTGVTLLLSRYYGDRAMPKPTDGKDTPSVETTSTTVTKPAENGKDTVRDKEGAESEGETTETEGTTDDEGQDDEGGAEKTARRRASKDGSSKTRRRKSSVKSGASGLKQGRKVKKGEDVQDLVGEESATGAKPTTISSTQPRPSEESTPRSPAASSATGAPTID